MDPAAEKLPETELMGLTNKEIQMVIPTDTSASKPESDIIVENTSPKSNQEEVDATTENAATLIMPNKETYLKVPGNHSNHDSNHIESQTDGHTYERYDSNASRSSHESSRGITRKLNRTRMTNKKAKDGSKLGFTKRGRTLRKTIRSTMKVVGGNNSSQYGVQPTGEQRLRTFVIKEILETEQQYLKLLKFMNNKMFPKLQKLADEVEAVSKEFVSTLRCNLTDLLSVHLKLCNNLESATEPFPFHTNRIGKYFTEMKDDFRVYDTYCSNFKHSQSIAYEIEKISEVKSLVNEWIKSIESSSRKFLRLEDFIISPVQRICKYPLLLRELLKYTSPHHADHKDVCEAHKMMENVTFSVNESERKSLLLQAIKDVESTCDAWENSGILEKQGFLTKCGGTVKTWNIRWCVLSHYKIQYYEEPVSEEPVGEIDLTAYRQILPECVKETKRPFSFGIKLSDRCYYMYATSEEERCEWLSAFRWKTECIERSRRQARNPFETAVFSSVSSFLNPKSLRLVEESNEEMEQSPPEIPQIKTVNSKFKSMKIRKSKFAKRKTKKSKKADESLSPTK